MANTVATVMDETCRQVATFAGYAFARQRNTSVRARKHESTLGPARTLSKMTTTIRLSGIRTRLSTAVRASSGMYRERNVLMSGKCMPQQISKRTKLQKTNSCDCVARPTSTPSHRAPSHARVSATLRRGDHPLTRVRRGAYLGDHRHHERHRGHEVHARGDHLRRETAHETVQHHRADHDGHHEARKDPTKRQRKLVRGRCPPADRAGI